MKKILGCVIVWLVCAASHAGTTFNVTKLVDNGPDDKRLVWVFVGDGYTSGQVGMFRVHVQTALTAMFSIEAAAAIAGHSAVGMTEHYSWQAQRTLAMQVAAQL